MANLFHTDKKAYIHDLTSTIAENAAGDTKKLLESYQERLRLFALFILERNITQKSKTELIENMFVDFPDIIAVSVIHQNGKDVILYDSNALAAAGMSKEDMKLYRDTHPLPANAIFGGSVYVENSTVSATQPMMTITLSYKQADNPPVLISGVINMDRLVGIVNRSKVFESLVLDRDGNIFATAQGGAGVEMQKADWLPADVMEITVDRNMSITNEYVKEGVEYIGGMAPIGIGGLLVVSQIRKSVAYLTARQLFGDLTGISLILLLASALLSLFLAHRITKPLERLAKATRSVGKGDFKIQVESKSNDEIGNLAWSFNRMADGLLERDEKLQKANMALVQSEKMSAFGQLSAGIAHEVKNPLTGILGYAQLCKRKLDKDDPLFQNMEIIEKETKRCRTIIDNLMRFARYEKSEHCEVNINEVINDASKIVNHQLSLNGVAVELDLHENLPLIMGNPNQLQQVFMNFLINAQQAMQNNGGKIRIQSKLLTDGQIEIQVVDNGPGIPDDIKNNIFEPFFTTKAAGEGTGLGLSVSYGIIRDHQGSISVNDGDAGGTVFRITLPVIAVAESAQATSEHRDSKSGAQTA